MHATHEQNVEKFYTHGSNHRGLQEGGFLSFGYWTYKNEDYHQAVDSLINHILISEKPINKGYVLNVACGYGSETLKIYEKIHPEKIFAIDITDRHIEFAKNQIEKSDLCGKIIFEKMDACTMPYKPLSFKYVIGVEGPAHFNTRKKFLQKAYEILDKKGVLLLSDITVNNDIVQKNLINKLLGKICAKYWYMPKENWMSTEEILETLKEIGFKIDSFEIAGDKVYPGFSKFNLKWKSIINAFRIRGIRLGVGLTIISWLLGYVYRKKMIDYTFIRAVKPI
jgi:ubiquinone/menaquinone biosynthesis C-methylase UbiE